MIILFRCQTFLSSFTAKKSGGGGREGGGGRVATFPIRNTFFYILLIIFYKMRNRAEKNDTNFSQDADINSKQNCPRECTVLAFGEN